MANSQTSPGMSHLQLVMLGLLGLVMIAMTLWLLMTPPWFIDRIGISMMITVYSLLISDAGTIFSLYHLYRRVSYATSRSTRMAWILTALAATLLSLAWLVFTAYLAHSVLTFHRQSIPSF